MSLVLSNSQPAGINVLTGFDGKIVTIGAYDISIEDFLIVAKYVLTNTDLNPDDPRLQFVECVKAMIEIDGYNKGGKRLESPLSSVKST